MKEKKSAQIFGPRTWCTKKSFGYRVIHQKTVKSHVHGNIVLKNVII